MDWLANTTRAESPNFDERPDKSDIDLLVIHSISLPPAQYEKKYVEQFFQNKLDPSEHPYFEEIAKLKVSAHLYIRRDGCVIQFVPLTKRAWHAGASSWQEREACNDYSVGIELEGCDQEPFSDEQYKSLGHITKEIQSSFPKITNKRIVGHSDIAPGRKTDPGPNFDWKRYLKILGVKD